MKTYRVIIQPEAERDIDEAHAYLEEQRHGLGFELLVQLSDAVALLETTPFAFQQIHGEKRRLVIKRFGYNLIYKVINTEVYIFSNDTR